MLGLLRNQEDRTKEEMISLLMQQEERTKVHRGVYYGHPPTPIKFLKILSCFFRFRSKKSVAAKTGFRCPGRDQNFTDISATDIFFIDVLP